MMMSIISISNDTQTISWGDVATWVTGIATILLFVIGFMQIQTERKARIRREKELENQGRREQAELISAWIASEDYGHQWVAILNQSMQPIYQVVVSIVALGDSGNERGHPSGQVCIHVVPPGKGYALLSVFYYGMHRRPGVEIAFQDKSGKSWVRKPLGELLELQGSTFESYDLDFPVNWQTLYNEIPMDPI